MPDEPLPERLVPSSALPCPECMYVGRGGDARIGNRRGLCKTCNRFVQSVIRLTQRRLRQLRKEEFAVIRAQVERDLYPQVISEWAEAHPIPQAWLSEELGL